MTPIALSNARAFALLLPLVSVPLACGDSNGSSSGLSVGNQPTTATTGAATDPTGGETVSSTMSEETETDGTASGSGTTTGPVVPTTGPEPTTSTTEPGTSTTTTTTGDPSGTSVGTTMPDKIPCDSEETEVVPVPPSVLLILDKSGSMSMEKWDHDAKPQTAEVTRWTSLHQVVEGVVTTFDEEVHFGVKLYPKIDAGSFVNVGACEVTPGVEVPIAAMNAAAVLAGIPAAGFAVLGGTPMETGLKRGYEYLKTLDPGLQRFAILVADGEISDTCQGENFLEAQAAVEETFNDFGIPTYVVGIDVDPSTSEQLSTLALAGGKPKPGPEPFYQTANQNELQAAIQQIVKDTLSCVIAVDPAPSEPELFEVWIDGQPVPEVASCAEDGYVWSVPHTEVTLCGAACDMLKETGKVQALYFCNPG
ncbi:vWA domain-containing protein [Nannocystis bainbridge]|uniref:VWA domain-containing protein n=1 Tax=Nannocystis bainbridge TaxID=2995303 RepID=A0ABT5E005_9BACT|nr:vWA domain-containing protein [Nannocystis bainbridge]MDC0718037.1 VWA domain-containing protein [Nannocystis bainbridge]